jgi:hypothetical protein
MEELAKLLSNSNENERSKILKTLLSDTLAEDNTSIEDYTSNLKTTYELLTLSNSKFQIGDLVVWKRGLQHKKLPKEDFPAIVMSILERPIIDTNAPVASPYHNEKLDIQLGLLDNKGRFLCLNS